jgi:hypothetical protein
MASRFLLLEGGRCIGDGCAEEVLSRPEALYALGLPVSIDAAQTAGEPVSWMTKSAAPETAHDSASVLCKGKYA